MIRVLAVAPLLADARLVPVAIFVVPWIPGKIWKASTGRVYCLEINSEIQRVKLSDSSQK